VRQELVNDARVLRIILIWSQAWRYCFALQWCFVYELSRGWWLHAGLTIAQHCLTRWQDVLTRELNFRVLLVIVVLELRFSCFMFLVSVLPQLN